MSLQPVQTKAIFDKRLAALLEHPDRANAEDDCRAFLRDYPRSPEAHFLVARALVEGKKKGEAFPFAESAHKIAPKNPHFTYYLGFLYLDFRLYEFALPLLREAASSKLRVYQFPEALGECYQELGQGERAIPFLRTALELANNDEQARTRILCKLTHVLTTSNRLEEAKPLIDKLLGMTGSAYAAGVAEAAHISKSGVSSVEGKRVSELLKADSLKNPQRIDLLLTLGRLLEKDKEYDEAFKRWTDAREISKQEKWRLRDHKRLLEEIQAFYVPEIFGPLAEHGHQTEQPVFIVGMPRSGTTLTEQILGSHPRAVGVGELARFQPLDNAFQRDYPTIENRLPKLLANAKMGELKRRAEESLRIFSVVAEVTRDRVVEKTPHNFRNVGYLRLLFPRAKFIHCRRNPLDTFISSFQNNLNSTHGYAYDQVEYAKEYLFQETIMEYWKSVFPDQIFTIHYEEMTTDPDHWARQLVAFIGLEWNDDCLNFHQTAKTVRTISTQQVRSPVNTRSIARWRRYEKHLAPLITALNLQEFKYPDLQ